MKKIFLIHGWRGTPEGGWRPWLRKELEKRGLSVFVPAMPDTNNPNVNAWLKKLTETVGTPDKNCFLVGHSLGCITILRYLETLKKNQEIGGAVLVAGRSYSLGKKATETFFKTLPDWKKIRTHCKKFIAIHSDNDYYVPLEESETFRKNLGAEIVLKPGMKHFTGEDGVTELPAALEAVLKLAGSR